MSIFDDPALQDFLRHYRTTHLSTPPIAVFDCDGTIIKGDIGEAMFYRQAENFMLRVNPANIWLDHPRRDELNTLYTALASLPIDKRLNDRRALSFTETLISWYFDQLKEGKTEKACSDIVRLFAKFSEHEVTDLADQTAQRELTSPIGVKRIGKHTVPTGVRYIQESLALLRELQSIGFDIWAISGSNVWSVRAIVQRLGIPRDRIIGLDLLSANGAFLPKVQSPVPVLDGKAEILRMFTTDRPVIVVSDSIYDIPLFDYSSHLKVLINSRMETSYTFFKEARIERDARWVVVENPTTIEDANV